MAHHPIQNSIVVVPAQPEMQPALIVHKKEPNSCRAAIPFMHIAMAVTCLILNIFVPGFGTLMAGFSVFCCGNPGQSGGGKFGTMCLNFWIGLLQLVTTALFLVGWVWSIMWGAAFIAMSDDHHQTKKITTVVTTTNPADQTVIVTQTTPSPQPYNPQPAQTYQPPQVYNQPSHMYDGQGSQGYSHPHQAHNPPLSWSQNYPQQPAYNPYHHQNQQMGQPPPSYSLH